MNTDRELLEKAAKAAGLESARYVDDWFDPECFSTKGIAYSDGVSEWLWNPLQNDADAFRLQCDLWLNIEYIDAGVRVGNQWQAIFDGDTAKYTRRAITTAAAELWRSRRDE